MQLERHSCFTCSGFGSRRERSYVWCERRRQVEADPSCGCCLWEREPGSDDEGEPAEPERLWIVLWQPLDSKDGCEKSSRPAPGRHQHVDSAL